MARRLRPPRHVRVFDDISSDPPDALLRTRVMSSPLFTIDADARLLISMIDALAIVRLRSDADLLLVEFTGGASRALRLSELIEQDDLFIELRIEHRVGHGVDGWVARLWSADSGSSSTMSSIRATSFAAFVGLE